MASENITQRAKALQALLGQSNRNSRLTAPSLKGQSFALASVDEWTRAWAESEVAVVTVTVECFRTWAQLWTLGELRISGGMVMGPTGSVKGSPPLLAPAMATSSLMPKRAEARQFCEKAAGIIDAWLVRVRDMLSVPNLLWFPTFAMHPGPVAPPTPCVLGRLSDMARLTGAVMIPALLAEELRSKATTPLWAKHFGDHQGDLGRIVSERIAKDLVNYVRQVFDLASVQGVMGFGNVVGFNPPVVTMGRVEGRTMPSVGFLRGVESVPSPLLTRA